MKATRIPAVRSPDPIKDVLLAVRLEVVDAEAKHGRGYASEHEAYAVLLEEVEEVWDEVRKKPSRRDAGAMYAELIQVAAVAARFALMEMQRAQEGSHV